MLSGVFFLNKINLDDRRRNTGLYFEKGINYMILNSIREKLYHLKILSLWIILEIPLKIDQQTLHLFNCFTAAATAKLLQSCPALCDPIDGNPPGFPVPGILQARTLEWAAISFSNASKWKVKVKSLSRIWLLATPWIAAYQAPPSMGFSKQEYSSGVPLPSPLTALGIQLWD